MSTPLHEIAARELRALGATSGEGAVRRLTMDIEVEGRTEMVTVRLRGDELQCVSSDACGWRIPNFQSESMSYLFQPSREKHTDTPTTNHQ